MNRIKIVSNKNGTTIYGEDGKILNTVIGVYINIDQNGSYADVRFAAPEVEIETELKERIYV